uniref:DUF4283 domain-containing protein n=1 Tax=Solanum tuberosum TaxID=4113 RepID=M1E0Z3_SOLTU
MAILSEVRRWASKNWNQAHSLNVYEMGNNCFLFEFTSINAAEHVLRGRWLWKNQGIWLQWWSPTVGAIQSRVAISQSWIRLVGLPLHLWSQNVFKAVGDFCGGWVKTEEETDLRNHLKWARILINRARDIKQLKGKELGLDPLAQQDCNLNEKQANILDWTSEPLLDKIQANYKNLAAPDREGDPVHLFHGDRDENFEFLADIRDDDDMSIIHTEERTTTETQTGNNMLLEHKGDGEGIIEDITPLNSEEQDIGIAAENEIPSWIQQNIIRLSKEFGVQFIGCEEAALNLFMKIDGKREAIEKMAGAIVPTTPTEKIPRELKNLEPAK